MKAKYLQDVAEEKELLILEKRDLYKKLTPFIKSSQIDNYLEYIKNDAQLLKEKKEITEKIIVKNKQLDNRVNILEEKIKEHREVLNDKLKFLIEGKIKDKINELAQNDKFQELTIELKKKVVEKMIIKIKISVKQLSEASINSDIIAKKQEIYKMLMIELQEFKKENQIMILFLLYFPIKVLF